MTFPKPPIQNKLVVLVGPTASGKSELAVILAKKFNGEIISADSRQVYKKMDLGTGKVLGIWQSLPNTQHPERSEGAVNRNKKFIYKSIPHYCIDFINPKMQYSAARFQRDARKAVTDILKRGKLPILCGGTGHWIDAVVYNQTLPDVKPNKKLRAALKKKSSEQLYAQLKKLDPNRAATIDRHNPRRLIRALEIVIATGKPVPTFLEPSSKYPALWLGIKTDQQSLYKKIDVRLAERLKQGMVQEVLKLRKSGLSWNKLEAFGLEYKFVAQFLQKKISEEEMISQLSYAIKHYSKRQLTWWKKNKEIRWFDLTEKAKFVKSIQKFLK